MDGTRRYSVQSATIRGAAAIPVQVEVAVSSGLPGVSIVGMPDAAIQEARERVRAAVRSCGFSMPREKVVFNLAPSFIRKTGSGFDMPMAAALLVATGQMPSKVLDNKMLVGELSLDGKIQKVNGLIAFQACARDMGMDLLCAPGFSPLPCDNRSSVFSCSSLRALAKGDFSPQLEAGSKSKDLPIDYAEVGGQRIAKRAMVIAAAGNHGLLMMGPPGAGKTMLAKRLPSILPPMSAAEINQAAQVASIAGEPIEPILHGMRPFRAPHHSATMAGLIGGGNPVRPGEVSLAHNGVLFLDELSEFSHSVLQSLRQPIEDGMVQITRADGSVSMPARFMLVASSNPCPCGYYGDSSNKCSCPPPRVQAYQNRIGGPLVDRFDMCIDVWRTSFEEVLDGDDAYSSANMRASVLSGREFAFERFRKANAEDISPRPSTPILVRLCNMDAKTKRYFRALSQSHVLSGRGIAGVLRVARTIADIAQSDAVEQEHIAEAVALRMRSSLSSPEIGAL